MQHTREPVAMFSHGPLVVATPEMTLRDAARLLHTSSIGAVAVRGEQHLIGIFSERDLVDALGVGADPDLTTVGAHMSHTFISARPSDLVVDVALLMLEDGIRHVPLVDEYGKDHGMVSLRDLIRPLVLQAMTPVHSDI